MLETLDYATRIGGTPIILYFDLYLYSAYAAHYVYFNIIVNYLTFLPAILILKSDDCERFNLPICNPDAELILL